MTTILKNFWLVVAVAVVASVAIAAIAAAPAAPEKHYFVITIDGANIAINYP